MALAGLVSRSWHCYTNGRAAGGRPRTSHEFRVYLKQIFFFVIRYSAIKACEVVEVDLRALLISELDGGVWSTSRPGRSILEEGPFHRHWIEGWIGSRSEMEGAKSRKVSASLCGRIRVAGSSDHSA
jgi:hypothetical protein